jgi:16S rRNA (cytosine967-C5)-methyltransferase
LEADNAPGPLGLIDLHPESIASGALQKLPSECVAANYSPLAFALVDGGNPSRVTSGSSGFVRVQDEGSQLAALVLVAARPVDPHERWLDMCAAPGGKAAVLAAFSETSHAELTVNEVNPSRLPLVRSALKPWSRVVVTECDGRDFAEKPGAFDRILVDAPCSGLGALRRRPEARWRKTPVDISSLTGIQHDLLDSALVALKPGGLVAYVTCSPHVAETRSIVNKALVEHPDCVERDVASVLNTVSRTPISSNANNLSVQLWPDLHGTDAMFISLLAKRDPTTVDN